MAIWISKFLGPVILALSIPMIVTPSILQETTRRFLADSPLVLISGILAMTAGLSIVNTHNVWVLDWTLIVTLFATWLGASPQWGVKDRRCLASWTELAAQ